MAEYASWGTGAGALSTGIIGTALGVLNGAGGLLGMANNYNNGYNRNYCEPLATKEDLHYSQELARKDSEIALLKSEQNTEVKIADVYERLITRINADKDRQQEINCQQAVNNARFSDGIMTLGRTLDDITTTHIPLNKVCPEPMRRYNYWTTPTTPAPDAEQANA